MADNLLPTVIVLLGSSVQRIVLFISKNLFSIPAAKSQVIPQITTTAFFCS